MSQHYLDSVRRRAELGRMARRQGWTSEGAFVIGQEIYFPDRRVEAVPETNNTRFNYDGSSDAWVRNTEFLDRKAMAGEALTVLLAFASPLLKLANMGGVMVLNYGEPRYGKTVLAGLMMSVWGYPGNIGLTYGADLISRLSTYDRHNSLPCLIDNGGDMPILDLSALSKEFSRGEAEGISEDRTTQKKYQWSSVLLLTGANSAMERIRQSRTRTTLIQPYILDYEIGKSGSLKTNALMIRKSVMENYGSVGRLYAQYLAVHQFNIMESVTNRVKAIKAGVRDPSHIDHLIALHACLIVGSELAQRLCLINFKTTEALNLSERRLQQISDSMRRIRPKVRTNASPAK